MAREATKTIPVKPETKEQIDNIKPDGVTHDHFQRQLLELHKKYSDV